MSKDIGNSNVTVSNDSDDLIITDRLVYNTDTEFIFFLIFIEYPPKRAIS
jgi:hypothetical protein